MPDTKSMQMRMPDMNDAIYFAGFFDGEGTVGIYSDGKYIAGLVNTDPRPLLRAQEMWGGSINHIRDATPGVQVLWRWSLHGQRTVPFLTAIRPFVIVKAEQIDTFLAVMRVIPKSKGTRRNPGVTELVDAAALRLRAMKRGA